MDLPEVEVVYFLYVPDHKLTKIGRTTNLNNRYRNFQSQIPCSIDLVNWISTEETRALEEALHKILRKSKVKSEWFNLSEEESHFVRSLSAEDIEDILSMAKSIEEDEREGIDSLRNGLRGIVERLNNDYALLGSWRAVGRLNSISASMACRVSKGYEPKDLEIRRKLGLSSTEYVQQVRDSSGRFSKKKEKIDDREESLMED